MVQVFQQTDWSGGSGQTGPISNPGNKFDTADANINYASTACTPTLDSSVTFGYNASCVLSSSGTYIYATATFTLPAILHHVLVALISAFV